MKNHYDEEDDLPDYEEFYKAMKGLKNMKAPGKDSITAEIIKYAGETCHKKIYNLIVDIWKFENMPKEWARGIIVPIHKKGKRAVCNNYRSITLLNVDTLEAHK